MPFGLKSAPEIFSRNNNKCFKDINNTIIYFDDLFVASESIESHIDTLTQIFERARKLNIKFNDSKFQFLKPEIKYLGLLFNKDGCKPDNERISALQHIQRPTCRKSLMSIMGMFNYLRDFIPNMAEITSALRVLLKKNIAWHWTKSHEDALQKLISIVSSPPTLANFDPNLPIVLECDSSKFGLGCCLLQQGQPIAFASRSLNASEINYPQIEKEMLSILFACNKYHNFIYGHKFPVLVFTDHKPLVSTFTKCKIVV